MTQSDGVPFLHHVGFQKKEKKDRAGPRKRRRKRPGGGGAGSVADSTGSESTPRSCDSTPQAFPVTTPPLPPRTKPISPCAHDKPSPGPVSIKTPPSLSASPLLTPVHHKQATGGGRPPRKGKTNKGHHDSPSPGKAKRSYDSPEKGRAKGGYDSPERARQSTYLRSFFPAVFVEAEAGGPPLPLTDDDWSTLEQAERQRYAEWMMRNHQGFTHVLRRAVVLTCLHLGVQRVSHL